jgi:serine/threonine protein kinase
MRVFLKCVAEAIAENGIKGLAQLVPGGGFIYTVAQAAFNKYRQKKNDAEVRAEIQQLALASFEEARDAAVEAARAAVEQGRKEDRIALELYLLQVPGMVRQSLKCSADPHGRTVPPNFAIRSADDLFRLLPRRATQFTRGDPLPGRPEWELVNVIGLGGFGEVWLARHRQMPTHRRAVKFCQPERARFLRHESELINRVMDDHGPHDHFVPLLDANLEGDPPWLMYDYVEGGDLAGLLREWQKLDQPLRMRQAMEALRQVCEAVAHFHGQVPPIVHRDLKPANILVDLQQGRRRGQLLVTDFGIGAVTAKAAADEEDGTTTRFGKFPETVRGAHTPPYASPQQLAGGPADPRDDVYSLGVIAYQLLTGQLARAPGTDFAHDLRERGAGESLIELIGDCVAQKAERRPADAGELLRRIQANTKPHRSASAAPLSSGNDVQPTPPQNPPRTTDPGLAASAPSPREVRSVTVPVPQSRSQDRDDEPLPRRREKSFRQRVPVWAWLAICFGAWILCCSVPMGLGLFGHRQKPTHHDTTPKLNSPNKEPVAPAPVTDAPSSGKRADSPPAATPETLPPTKAEKKPPVGGLPSDVAAKSALERRIKESKSPEKAFRLEAAEGLAPFLTHSNPLLRRKAAQALAEMGADAEPAAPALRGAIKDGDVEVRKNARLALDKIDVAVAEAKAAKTRESILATAKDLKAREAAKRIKALEQLAGYGPDANIVGEQLIEALTDKIPAVQTAASDALQKANPKVYPHVVTLLFGNDKVGAVKQLEQLGAEAAITVPLLLYLLDNPPLHRSGMSVVPVDFGDLFATIAKIAPKDKRFATAVLAAVARPIPASDAKMVGAGMFIPGTLGLRRISAVQQLSVIDADVADKVKSLVAALGDGQAMKQVIEALGGYGKDAAPALPLLKKLKLAPNDAVREAATRAVEKIEWPGRCRRFGFPIPIGTPDDAALPMGHLARAEKSGVANDSRSAGLSDFHVAATSSAALFTDRIASFTVAALGQGAGAIPFAIVMVSVDELW